jgi:hypothetical protein
MYPYSKIIQNKDIFYYVCFNLFLITSFRKIDTFPKVAKNVTDYVSLLCFHAKTGQSMFIYHNSQI